ncbi:MAG: hypothetical protein ACKV2V_30695 [Blastocatellia bacterium]
MKRKSKQEMVIEIYDREAMGEVTAREIAIINAGLIAEFGEGGAMSPAEIAHILAREELPVRFDQMLAMQAPRERYSPHFAALLASETIDDTERLLAHIDELETEYRRKQDRFGSRAVLDVLRKARQRSYDIANDPGADAARRAAHAEITQWLTIRLQTPDTFPLWVELRKAEVRRQKAEKSGVRSQKAEVESEAHKD